MISEKALDNLAAIAAAIQEAVAAATNQEAFAADTGSKLISSIVLGSAAAQLTAELFSDGEVLLTRDVFLKCCGSAYDEALKEIAKEKEAAK